MSFRKPPPLYPFSQDPTKLNSIFSLTIAVDIPPGGTQSVQADMAEGDFRLLDIDINFLNGAIDISAFEGVEAEGGTLVTTGPGNVDRTSPIQSKLTAYTNPTSVTGGIQLVGLPHFGITTDVSNFAQGEPLNVEYITLKPNTTYLFTLKNPTDELITSLHFLMLWAE